MLKDFQNLSIFNVQNPDMISPRSTQLQPFPFEDMDELLAELYVKFNTISIKLEAAEINPANDTKARKKTLRSLKYKNNTILSLIKSMSMEIQQFGISGLK